MKYTLWIKAKRVTSLLAICFTLLSFPVVDFTEASVGSLTVIQLDGERVEQSSAVAADFDGDGDKEIVIGGRDGKLYVLAYQNDAWSVVWTHQTADDLNTAGAPTKNCDNSKSDIRSAPAIGDLDNDGHLEIIVTTGGDPGRTGTSELHRNGGVLVYRYDYAWSFDLVSGWPQPKLDVVGANSGATDPDGCWDGIWSSPTLGDLDGDGDLEVVVEGFDRRLHVWHHDGTYMNGWPIGPGQIYRGGWATPSVADLDKDGSLEVVFATDNNPGDAPPYYLYVFEGNGSVRDGFPVEAAQNMQSSPAIGDIDGDGWLDIVVGTGGYEPSGGNKVYAWDRDGNSLSGWPKTTGGDMPASPALGDLDGDGDLEVVIGCGAEGDPYDPAPCSYLYAWHGNGNEVNGFPMEVGPNNPWEPQGDPLGLPYSPILSDYDSDGQIEILVQNRWSWGISTVEQINGVWRQNNDSNLRTNAPLSSTPLVDDVDGDGKVEIVVGGAFDQEQNLGGVYIWNADVGVDRALPWPMFHHDVYHTGVYGNDPQAPKLYFPDQVTIFHDAGSSEPATGSVAVQNQGSGYIEWQISESIDRLSFTPMSGVVTDVESIPLQIEIQGLGQGRHILGNVTVTGQFEGVSVEGNPATATVQLYIGDVSRTYLPLALCHH